MASAHKELTDSLGSQLGKVMHDCFQKTKFPMLHTFLKAVVKLLVLAAICTFVSATLYVIVYPEALVDSAAFSLALVPNYILYAADRITARLFQRLKLALCQNLPWMKSTEHVANYTQMALSSAQDPPALELYLLPICLYFVYRIIHG
eukprot:8347366-Karenia_brevis.AAC.1